MWGGGVDDTGFWEWKFNNFPSKVHAIKVGGGYFKDQENIIGDSQDDREGFGKNSWDPKIQRSEFKSYLKITLELGA